ncbi:MAG: CehA/McbA family metallohydrolase [Humibacillus sp.]
MTTRTLLDVDLSWRPVDRAEHQYREVSFEVPGGVGAIEVVLARPDDGETVVDLGLEGPEGYIGWSGGARSRLIVSREWATPGYLPTAADAGEWRVLLGLHRIPTDGVVVHLTARSVTEAEVKAHRDAEPTEVPPSPRPQRRSRLPDLDGMHWLAGDFHSHTVHSDGSLPISGLAALAVSRGLDFLAVTDHNTTSHHPHLAGVGQRHGIHLLPGQEVTRDTGHANVFGDIGFVDFRMPQADWASDAHSRGGLLSVNHPLAADCAWLEPVESPPVAEVWHSSWSAFPGWGAPLAWWLMTPGTTPIGGSDFHRHGSDGQPGSPTTWVLCDGDDVLGGVRAGRTAVSASLDGPLLVRHGDDLLALGADGLLLAGPGGRRRSVVGDSVRLPAPTGPCWLEDERRVVHALTG